MEQTGRIFYTLLIFCALLILATIRRHDVKIVFNLGACKPVALIKNAEAKWSDELCINPRLELNRYKNPIKIPDTH